VGNPAKKQLKEDARPCPGDLAVSGELAKYSGIYHLEHENGKPADELFIKKGTRLPICDECGAPVKFRLVRRLDHISEDPDFA